MIPRKVRPARLGLATSCLLLSLLAGSAGGEAIRLPVTRDTWFSGVGDEADANLGGSPRLKLKSYQEMSLVDIDPASLRGRVVVGATLHLRSLGEPRLRRLTVGTFGADWVEGTSPAYAPQVGASTFRHRRHPDLPWAAPGGDLCDVILGEGGTTWRSAEATPPGPEGWQSVAVDPLVVAARVAGVSRGFLLFDDTGSEWTRRGEAFEFRAMPNRFVASRESNRASAPYFLVELGEADRSPPPAPAAFGSEADDLPAGEAIVSWATPRDDGPAGTVGFVVALDGRDLPQHFAPLAGRPGDRVEARLRGLGLAAGSTHRLAVRAVDGAGNVGPEGRAEVVVSNRTSRPLPAAVAVSPAEGGPLPRLGEAEVAVVDELDKRDPTSGRLVPGAVAGYLASNHLWDARQRRARLRAARNEFVGFQVVLLGPARALVPTVRFANPAGLAAEVGRLEAVATGRGPMPDPVVPLAGPVAFPQAGGSLYVEVYVGHGVKPGVRQGTLSLEDGESRLTIAVELEVLDFALPDALSFLPELNCYDLPEDERAYYRLAHRHRAALNRVPYSQRGRVAPGLAPTIDGDRLDWSAWDRRFGPLFDGSAFADLPRRGVPVDVFYLPLHENWPTPIEGNYNGDYWADRGFTPAYRRSFVHAAREFAAHLDARAWRATTFEGFLNNKVDFKKGAAGWSGGTSPWLLDEPASFQDFAALRYFAAAFREGVAAARPAGPGRAKLAFRADISRPEWQRDSLDGLLDVEVVGGAFRDRSRIVLDRKRREGQLVLEYGTVNPVDESNVGPAAWCLDAWSLGLDGLIPWQTIGRAESWTTGDELALLYPARPGIDRGPVPSLRLKAIRRGQQDVEYLALLGRVEGEPRWAIGERARAALGLAGDRRSAGGDDAGSIRYDRTRPADLAALRDRVGRALSNARPPATTPIEWRPRPRGPAAGGGRP